MEMPQLKSTMFEMRKSPDELNTGSELEGERLVNVKIDR